MNIYQFFEFLWLVNKLGILLNDWHTSLHIVYFEKCCKADYLVLSAH